MSNNFCTEEDDETIEFNEFDYILLFKALDAIRVTSKEFLNNQLTNEEAYKKLKLQYSTYTCKFKRNVTSSRGNRNSVNTMFKVFMYVTTILYSLWVIRDLYRSFRGVFDCKTKYKLPFLYSLISLVLFNPVYSLVTISFEILHIQSLQNMDKRKFEQLKLIEEQIENALSCEEDFSREKVCRYYIYFDDEKLCDCGGDSKLKCKDVNDNELLTDMLTNKMQKLDNVHQFFENQKKFVLKLHNPFIQIKNGDKVEPLVECLLGNVSETLIRENLNVSDADEILSENSQQIRNNLPKLLNSIESFQYKQLGEVESYQKYFIEELNLDLFNLTHSVLNFLGDKRVRQKYFINNIQLVNYEQNERDSLIFRCDPVGSLPLTTQEYEMQIYEHMLKVQTKLRRLNQLWLPEYEDLRRALYEPILVEYTEAGTRMTSRIHKQYKTSKNIQQAIYKSRTIEDMKPLLMEVVTVVLENTFLINFKDRQERYVSVDDDNDNLPFVCYEEDNEADTGSRVLKYKVDSNLKKIQYTETVAQSVETLYEDGYKTKQTLLMPKIKTFIESLKLKGLQENFHKTFKTESKIVKNIILNQLEDLIGSSKNVNTFIQKYVDENSIFKDDENDKKYIFLSNCKKLIDFAGKQQDVEMRNSELYFSANNSVENPKKYIKYNEFLVKLENIDKPQFTKYIESVESAKNDVVYFIDNIQQLNNKLEHKHQLTEYYNKYIVIYIIVSFLILVDVSLTTYTGQKNFIDMAKLKACNEDSFISKNKGKFFKSKTAKQGEQSQVEAPASASAPVPEASASAAASSESASAPVPEVSEASAEPVVSTDVLSTAKTLTDNIGNDKLTKAAKTLTDKIGNNKLTKAAKAAKTLTDNPNLAKAAQALTGNPNLAKALTRGKPNLAKAAEAAKAVSRFRKKKLP